jgi:hypothetical protein
MTKKTRLIILTICVACFFVIAPVLVFYSMGYRLDFEKKKIVATGGIYVRTYPAADQIIIDSKISQKPGIFANSIFVQSLLPKDHTVSINKNGYYDYFKTLPVLENQVTKLENVTLIKESLAYSDLADKIDYFSITPNNQNILSSSANANTIILNYFAINNPSQPKTFYITQAGKVSEIKWSDDSSKALIKIQNLASAFYYVFDGATQKPTAARLPYLDRNSQQISFNPRDNQQIFYVENNTLYSLKNSKAPIVINNIVAYKISDGNIIWLSSAGALNKSDISGKLIEKLSTKNILINSQKSYEIIIASGITFLKDGSSLFLFNQDVKSFESFNGQEADKILASPDSKNLVYWNNNKIYIYSFLDKKSGEIFSGAEITDCQWLNNDYIIFSAGDKIIISEIDYRGNINAVTLPATLNTSNGKTIATKTPQIFFDPQSGKLYILTGNALLSSEKITS